MLLNELVLSLTMWIGAATGQPPVDPPPIKILPAALLHYQYCETTAPDSVDECLAERFTTPAFLDSDSGIIYVSQRFKPANERDRANLVIQLARHAGEVALRKTGHAAKYEGHEDIIDCGIHFERAARELGRSFLLENGATDAALPFEVEDGMKPWSCSPAAAAQTARTAAEPGF